MKIALVTCTYGRPELSREVLEYHSRIDLPGISLSGVVGGWVDSWGHYEANFGVEWWRVARVSNFPLGAKWNAVLQKARQDRPDAVMVLGSDDLIHPMWVAHAAEKIADGFDVVKPCQLWIANARTDQLAFCQHYDSGAGRTYSKALLDRMEWTLWTEDQAIGLDTDAETNIIQSAFDNRRSYKEYTEHDMSAFPIVDIKEPGGENIWKFQEALAIATHKNLEVSARRWIKTTFPNFNWPVFSYRGNMTL